MIATLQITNAIHTHQKVSSVYHCCQKKIQLSSPFYTFLPPFIKNKFFLIHCILIAVSLPSPPISFPPPLSRSTFSLEKNVFLRDINQTTTSRLDIVIQQNGKSPKSKHINQRLTCLHLRSLIKILIWKL